MTEDDKKKLIEAGRGDLIRMLEVIESGYAGVSRNGMIVDRRNEPSALPVQKNVLMNVPEPKPVASVRTESFYICGECGRDVYIEGHAPECRQDRDRDRDREGDDDSEETRTIRL